MEKAHNRRFLGFLGFLGFLAFLPFKGSPLPYLSLIAVPSLLALVPFDKSRVRRPIDPRGRIHLGFLGMLFFLGFLWTDHPEMAMLACMAALSNRPI